MKRVLRILFLLGLLLAVGVYAASGFYTLSPNEVSIVLRFGEYREEARDTGQGLKYRLPWPIEREYVIGTQIRTTSVGFRMIDYVQKISPQPEECEWLTGDQNLITIQMVIEYYVEDPEDYLFNLQDDPRFFIRWLAESALTEAIGTMTFDQAFSNRTQIAMRVLERTQELIGEYETGLRINNVTPRFMDPPAEVSDVFRAIHTEYLNIETQTRAAQQYADRLSNETRAEVTRILNEANAYAQSRIIAASATYQAFSPLAEQHAGDPEGTRRRIYLEKMATIIPQMKLIQAGSGTEIHITTGK